MERLNNCKERIVHGQFAKQIYELVPEEGSIWLGEKRIKSETDTRSLSTYEQAARTIPTTNKIRAIPTLIKSNR